MNYDKYIGKGWSYSSKRHKTEIYYIIDIRVVDVERTVRDEEGNAVFDEAPRRGGGTKLFMRRETVRKPALLAIKVTWSGSSSSSRYSITNPTSKYAVSDKFLKELKRYDYGDKLVYECIEYLFKKGFDKWKKRYSGYKNIIK